MNGLASAALRFRDTQVDSEKEGHRPPSSEPVRGAALTVVQEIASRLEAGRLRHRHCFENCWTSLGMYPGVLINASVAMPYPMARAVIASPRPRSPLSGIWLRATCTAPTAKTARTAIPNTHNPDAAMTAKMTATTASLFNRPVDVRAGVMGVLISVPPTSLVRVSLACLAGTEWGLNHLVSTTLKGRR